MMALAVIGNRDWGQGVEAGYPAWLYSHPVAVFLMTLGEYLQHPYPVWALAATAPAILFWRMWGTRAWFKVFTTHKWAHPFLRGLAGLPLAGVMTYLQWHIHLHLWYTPAIIGIVSVFTFAVCYWLGARIAVWTLKTKYPVETVATAEMLAGLNLALIGL